MIPTRLRCTAFAGYHRIASGELLHVALKAKQAHDADPARAVRVFDDGSGEVLDLPLALPAAELVRRLSQPELQRLVPAEVSGVSKEVEVTLRQQPGKNRMMVHLLDYDTTSAGVKGARLTVHPPAGKTVKRIFYPDTDTAIAFAAAETDVTAELRDFEIHDMVVVEWNP